MTYEETLIKELSEIFSDYDLENQPLMKMQVLYVFRNFSAQREAEIVKAVEGLKCDVPDNVRVGAIRSEENINKAILRAGRFNYNRALNDFLALITKR